MKIISSLHSERVLVPAGEVVVVRRAVVTHHTDHLVQLRADLHAARQTTVFMVSLVGAVQASHLSRGLVVQLLEVGVSDYHLALPAAHSRAVVVVGDLVGRKGVLRVAAVAVGVYPRSLISF